MKDRIKTILLHLFYKSDFQELQAIGRYDEDIALLFEKAFTYASGGNHEVIEKQAYLKSIFAGLAGYQSEHGFNVQPLGLTKDYFPLAAPQQTNIRKNLQLFVQQYQQVAQLEGQAFGNTVLALMEQYLTTIPCGVHGLDDVSLHHHYKSMAGFLTCLTQTTDKAFPCLLVAGDISGIQDFIYDIISKDASKNLKGRSFYLQMLQESMIRRLLNKLQLFQANIIYDSGGNFYLLAPNSEKTHHSLQEEEWLITKQVFEHHKTSLGIALDWITLSEWSLLNNLAVHPNQLEESVFGQLHAKLNTKKKRQFASVIHADFEQFFADNGIGAGGLHERDSMSNEELDLSQPIFEIPDDGKVRKLSAEAVQETGGESRKLIGAVSKDLIDLGSELTHLHYLAISPEPTKTKRGYNPCSLGIYYHILAQKDLKDLSTYSNQIELRCINQFSPNVQAKLGTSTSFYGGNETPTIAIQKSNGKVLEMAKTFSEMAGQKDDSRSYAESFHALAFTRLGVLRMDVDGLGAVFSQGQFAQNKRTLSRYATLSHSLDFFFKGYLNKIWEEDEQLYKYSQIIYAGGDDLFIVGRWDLLISFAEKIQQAFRTWSCGNTKLGISGGLAIVTPKFPIAKAADMSGEAEKAAKSHDYGDEIWKKNSITLFGKPLHWEHEYPIVKALKEEILALNKAVIGPLGKIQSYYVKSAVAHQEGAVELENNQQGDLAWRWQLAYHITRAAERYKKDQAFCTFLKKIKNNIFIGKDPARKSWNTAYEYFELLSLAIRWAELERRTTR